MPESFFSFKDLQPVLTSEQMRSADAETISGLGIGGFTLMEVAGRRVADVVIAFASENAQRQVQTGEPPAAARTTIFCGTGNNGGDGFVAARVLLENGVGVCVRIAGDIERIKGDALAHFNVLIKSAEHHTLFDLVEITSDTGESTIRVTSSAPFSINESDVLVDALIGTGLQHDVRGKIKTSIESINSSGRPVISVDIPSGLCSDTGNALGTAVVARQTVVIAALKTGMLLNDGPLHVGKRTVAEIGIPAETIRRVQENEDADEPIIRLMNNAFSESRRIRRTPKSNKYTSGPTLVIAGSAEFTGAPYLASVAAARAGSGYVQCICPPGIHSLLAEKLNEIPVVSWELEDTPGDSIADFASATVRKLGERFRKQRCALIGPGLGRTEQIEQFVLSLLEQISIAGHTNVVLDADGLYAIKNHRAKIRSLSAGRWILTPHTGEAKYLSEGIPSLTGGDIRHTSPIIVACALARAWNCIVLLKGFPSVTASPDGRVIINDSTNASAATAGTGDVLAGMVAGICAQGVEPFDAAASAVYRSSRIAELYCRGHASESLMASDILDHIAMINE